jgi:hypothetical protein
MLLLNMVCLTVELAGKSVSDVGIVTQSSASNLHHLLPLSLHWSGPVSISVFASQETDLVLVLDVIQVLKRCSKDIQRNFAFHLLFPRTQTLVEKFESSNFHEISCEDAHQTLKTHFKNSKNYVKYSSHGGDLPESSSANQPRFEYPVNLLRNVAIRNAEVDFVFVIDVDMLPSPRLRREFLTFARSKNLFNSSSTKNNRIAAALLGKSIPRGIFQDQADFTTKPIVSWASKEIGKNPRH